MATQTAPDSPPPRPTFLKLNYIQTSASHPVQHQSNWYSFFTTLLSALHRFCCLDYLFVVASQFSRTWHVNTTGTCRIIAAIHTTGIATYRAADSRDSEPYAPIAHRRANSIMKRTTRIQYGMPVPFVIFGRADDHGQRTGYSHQRRHA